MKPRRTWTGVIPPVDLAEGLNASIRSLTPERLVVLVGAGASVDAPSSLPTACEFLERLYATCLPTSVESEWLLGRQGSLVGAQIQAPRFEAVMSIIQRHFDTELEILDYLTARPPNRVHRLLADLAQRGALIMTTNFDELIETAAQPNLPSIADSDGFRSVAERSRQPGGEVWHLHGTVSDRKTVVASVRDCWESRHLFRLGQDRRAALAGALAERDLLVVGYSGSDDFDICPALEEVESDCRWVWIDHGSRLEDLDSLKIIDQLPDGESWYRHSGRNCLAAALSDGHREARHVTLVRCETADALASIGGALAEPQEDRAGANELETFLTRWQKVRLPSVHDRYLLAVLLCRLAGRHEERALLKEAVAHALDDSGAGTASFLALWFMALESEPSLLDRFRALDLEDTIFEMSAEVRCAFLTSLGRAVASSGDLERAIERMRESVEIRRSLPTRPDLAAGLHALAEALFRRGFPTRDLREARSVAAEALRCAKQDSNPEGMARCHLLLARIHERFEEFSSAARHYEQARDAAFVAAEPTLIAVTAGELGLFLWEQGDAETHGAASQALAEAYRLHFRQGDAAALLIIASNLALCLTALGDLERSLLAHSHAFQCARALNDESVASESIEFIRPLAKRLLGLVSDEVNRRDAFVASVIQRLTDDDVSI